jgi:hypothetical protein
MREGDSREENKEEGRGLGEGSSFIWDKLWKRGKRRRKLGEHIVLGNSYRGTIVAGNFGLGGQETARIPGARYPKRLFLVGWEVNIQFGQE